MHAADTPTACENCATALQGEYCHVCGQHAHNPLRSFAHAVEEVFESFWHLDGRVFRTLRDLLVPGRVACNYLKGHRVRYIPPLRLFVVLTVLTFFVGRLLFSTGETTSVRIGTGEDARRAGVQIDGRPGSTFADATTEAEVVKRRDEALAGLAEGRRTVGALPMATQGMARAEAKVRADAELRIAELRRAKRGATSTATPSSAKADAATAAARADDEPDPEGSIDRALRGMGTAHLKDPRVPWNAKTNPVDMSWLPAWGDRWLNHKLESVGANARRFSKGDGNFVKAFVAAMPTALFLMMPVFALMLRVVYVRRPWGFLEHLVVALYSHAFLLLAMMGIFVFSALGDATVPGVSALFYLLMAAVIVYIPVYLLIMQKRVYGQGWLKTVVKYLLIGGAYQFLLGMAATFAALLPFLGE